MKSFEHPDKFVNRHIGVTPEDLNEMLKVMGFNSLEELIDETIPSDIKMKEGLNLSPPVTEYRFIEHLKKVAKKNKVFKSYIGMGYYTTITPAVIQRNILENPGWYTQYTPYQAEIAQGRLEALLNYQTVIIDLTALPIANASLLDEGTAAAEAMIMFYALRKNKNADVFFVSEECFPQTIDVLKTRAEALGIKIKTGSHEDLEFTSDIFGLLVQYPSGLGEIYDYEKLFNLAAENGIYKLVAADLLSLTLLKPPGEFGADAVVGSTQRFGVPKGYGGPHAAYLSTKDEYKRHLPGRIIGASVDSHGNPALRMALQTREQHIRREKATSNICTAQVLLAVMAGMYAVYHGPAGLKAIAERIHGFASFLDSALRKLGFNQVNKSYFDTLCIALGDDAEDKVKRIRTDAEALEINFRYVDKTIIGISINETTDLQNIYDIISLFSGVEGKSLSEKDLADLAVKAETGFEPGLSRLSPYLTHPVFSLYNTETEMMRYIKRLENKDLSLMHSMIPLGSCTMKLNATSEMLGITWPEFAKMHPFAPQSQTAGYQELFREFERDLAEITGFAAVSLQPNSGAQGEYTGLLVIRKFHISRNESHRNVVLIPSSAHGTNPASAVMAGMKVVVVECDKHGNVSLEDMEAKAVKYKDNLAALMITYPSTHGVFEAQIKRICEVIHENGGLVYMDGANMNAQVGLTSPALIGADVCHINLHKTFCIPHGGGGPGMGPIAVTKQLAAFLPEHPVVNLGHKNGIGAVSAAPWGSADIIVISYAYIKMMGAPGLTYASKIAILNANYIKARLENIFPVLYSARNGRVAHELIFDMRHFKTSANIEVEDIAKRLMDYGFHAPTVSFPVPGTLMVEPTESESKSELDRFCDALIAIRNEIKEIEEGTADKTDNVLKNSPHTLESVIADEWTHSYSREKAAYPLPWTRKQKFWATVGRINSAYGDRNLICSCLPIAEYAEA